MQGHGHFGKFDQAIGDLTTALATLHRKGSPPIVQRLCAAAAVAIKTGQRFYLPEAVHVLTGRRIDTDVKEVIRLPYDCTAVLSETFFGDRAPGDIQVKDPTPSWKISIAFDVEGDFNRSARLVPPGSQPGPGFALVSVFRSPTTGTWVMLPTVGYCELVNGADGFKIHEFDSPIQTGLNVPEEIADDAMAVMNLCAMLGLHNVKAINRDPPEKLNRARARKGKLPLYSYHVLSVDGEAWDSPGTGGDEGGGVRSHLRRGHIRRIEGGSRRIWVRATFVRGSRPGFVDKDYRAGGTGASGS